MAFLVVLGPTSSRLLKERLWKGYCLGVLIRFIFSTNQKMKRQIVEESHELSKQEQTEQAVEGFY